MLHVLPDFQGGGFGVGVDYFFGRPMQHAAVSTEVLAGPPVAVGEVPVHLLIEAVQRAGRGWRKLSQPAIALTMRMTLTHGLPLCLDTVLELHGNQLQGTD
ncbi:hypothetical protein D3C81_1558230 [compost metagenome]